MSETVSTAKRFSLDLPSSSALPEAVHHTKRFSLGSTSLSYSYQEEAVEDTNSSIP